MRILSIILLITIVSCSHLSKTPKDVSNEVAEVNISYQPKNITINAGEVELVSLTDSPLFDEPGHIDCHGHKIPFYENEQGIHFYLAESYFSKKKPFRCVWKEQDRAEVTILNVTIGSLVYPSEKLNVDKKRVVLNKKDLARAIAEKKILDDMYQYSSKTPYFNKPFVLPLNSKVTSVYGTQRIYNNHKKGQHLGVDFRAKVGTPIKVANRGKVVLVKNLFFTGGTVIVDHGLGIFSVYAHMSKFLVSKGDIVEQGDVVGLSGMTGRVTGPHLHWGIRIQNNWINGMSLVKTTQDLGSL